MNIITLLIFLGIGILFLLVLLGVKLKRGKIKEVTLDEVASAFWLGAIFSSSGYALILAIKLVYLFWKELPIPSYEEEVVVLLIVSAIVLIYVGIKNFSKLLSER